MLKKEQNFSLEFLLTIFRKNLLKYSFIQLLNTP